MPLWTITLEETKEQMNNYNISPFISGSICGAISVLFTLPSSFICNNYVLKKEETNLINFTRTILKNPGQLFSGFKPEL